MTTKKRSDNSVYSYYKGEADNVATVSIFDVIENDSNTSEGKITEKTGLAAGLVHSFMRKVLKKGWVRVNKVSPKRWAYFLTPEGFMEKSRLSINYLSGVFSAYREAQEIVKKELESCIDNGYTRLAVAGSNELAEIAALNIQANPKLNFVGYFVNLPNNESGKFKPLINKDILETDNFDKIFLCDPDLLNSSNEKLFKNLLESQKVNELLYKISDMVMVRSINEHSG